MSPDEASQWSTFRRRQLAQAQMAVQARRFGEEAEPPLQSAHEMHAAEVRRAAQEQERQQRTMEQELQRMLAGSSPQPAAPPAPPHSNATPSSTQLAAPSNPPLSNATPPRRRSTLAKWAASILNSLDAAAKALVFPADEQGIEGTLRNMHTLEPHTSTLLLDTENPNGIPGVGYRWVDRAELLAHPMRRVPIDRARVRL
jgi:hypothetical protein